VSKTPIEIDMLVDSALWSGLEADLTRALLAAAAAEGAAGTVCLFLGADEALARLNAEFRGKEGPTNVLSFPAGEGAAPGFLGDIALAAETIAREAAEQGKTIESHAAHMAVHGFLHLLGYDHIVDVDAAVMEDRERVILASLGIADPYAE